LFSGYIGLGALIRIVSLATGGSHARNTVEAIVALAAFAGLAVVGLTSVVLLTQRKRTLPPKVASQLRRGARRFFTLTALPATITLQTGETFQRIAVFRHRYVGGRFKFDARDVISASYTRQAKALET
jgi:hypothetical protein